MVYLSLSSGILSDLQDCSNNDQEKRNNVERKFQENEIESLVPNYNPMKSEIESTAKKRMTTLKNEEKKDINKNSVFIHYKQKQKYLEKLEILEAELKSEMGNLHDRIEKIQSEIAIYENLGALKNAAAAKRDELLQKKQIYLNNQNSIKEKLEIVKEKYVKIQNELQENETQEQLQALEYKLLQIELNNFALKQFLTEKRFEVYNEVSEPVTSLNLN